MRVGADSVRDCYAPGTLARLEDIADGVRSYRTSISRNCTCRSELARERLSARVAGNFVREQARSYKGRKLSGLPAGGADVDGARQDALGKEQVGGALLCGDVGIVQRADR